MCYSICVVWLTLLSCQKLELNQGKIMTHHISHAHTHMPISTKKKKSFFPSVISEVLSSGKLNESRAVLQYTWFLVYVHHCSATYIFKCRILLLFFFYFSSFQSHRQHFHHYSLGMAFLKADCLIVCTLATPCGENK